MNRLLPLLAGGLLLVGCGGMTPRQQQADEAASIAAAGALLAHGAARGGTLGTFTRVHAGELRARAEALAEHAADRRLRRVARAVAEALGRLERHPDDRPAARRIERRLEGLRTIIILFLGRR